MTEWTDRMRKRQVFLCYRRSDTGELTGRLHDRLVARYGRSGVFKDVFSIDPGQCFDVVIRKALEHALVVLVVIGDAWDVQRLASPTDSVRIEIEQALALGVRVIPVLVRGTLMPASQTLPDSLQELVRRNAIPLRDDPDFEHDVKRLLHVISPRRRWLAPKAWISVAILSGIALALSRMPDLPVSRLSEPTAGVAVAGSGAPRIDASIIAPDASGSEERYSDPEDARCRYIYVQWDESAETTALLEDIRKRMERDWQWQNMNIVKRLEDSDLHMHVTGAFTPSWTGQGCINIRFVLSRTADESTQKSLIDITKCPHGDSDSPRHVQEAALEAWSNGKRTELVREVLHDLSLLSAKRASGIRLATTPPGASIYLGEFTNMDANHVRPFRDRTQKQGTMLPCFEEGEHVSGVISLSGHRLQRFDAVASRSFALQSFSLVANQSSPTGTGLEYGVRENTENK